MTPEEIMAPILEAAERDHGINTADGVRALANGMFNLVREWDGANEQQLIDNLAFLSGMACAALLDYAVMLDDERVEIGESQAS